MAIRNIDAIRRRGDAVAAQVANEKAMREGYFWNRVKLIRENRQDAIDAIDTIIALYNNGLGKQFEEWENQFMKVRVSRGSEYAFRVSLDGCNAYYYPVRDIVEFSWYGHGMYEHYSTGDSNKEYVIDRVTRGKDRTYDTLLTELATGLGPYLKDFFMWLEKL